MHNRFIPKRGLHTCEIIALFVMVGAQFFIGGFMLRGMGVGWGFGVDSGMGTGMGIDTGMGTGIADVLPIVKERFNGSLYNMVKMNEGEGGYFVGEGEGERVGDRDRSKAEKGRVREAFRMMMDEEIYMTGKRNKITEIYLDNIGEMIRSRIADHREFVIEKKDFLRSVLGDMVDAVYGIEGIVGMAATSTGNTGEEASQHHPQNKYMEPGENIWSGTLHQEEKATRFHKIAKQKMEKGDFEGVLKMISETLSGFESLFMKKSREEDRNWRGDEETEKVREEVYRMVEEKKRMVYRGVMVSGEILRGVQREMVEMEGWVEGMRDFLVGVCGEVLGRG
ncbi:hypothetical protein sscle_13g093250 [Sclerotinia sclerotiorum 1980 UF-70]|uniref:Uncharacterized protein n=1 Tax=Sclerotinia sclerotiorum (strain ATCC 18683 / 1980 / Ss-1) TaxID=665079 RepID=A0A1D9QHX6_SCLS1|nr:hypothetical protein sscle_13g093250 [Sclerotinia sclerotiorum 1980 UF-70]